MLKKKYRKIYIEVREINSCGECPNISPNSQNLCEALGSKPVELPNCYDGIPKWCPLENSKDVKVNIKRKAHYWKNKR